LLRDYPQACPLSSTFAAVMVFVGTFGASMLAIKTRGLLPAHHLQNDSKKVLELVVGLTSTLTALVLGLLISSAYSAYQLQRIEIQDLGTRFFEVDRALANLGPEASEQRQQLQRILLDVDKGIWPDAAENVSDARTAVQIHGEALFSAIAALPTASNAQRLTQGRAAQLLEDLSGTWHLLLVQRGGSLSAPIFWVLTSWLVLLFFGFGLFTSYNPTVATGLFVGAASVSAAIFLIVDLNQPYSGWIRLPRGALQAALAQMGH
jgi:hypothetical protein